jgi:hypothetical protein
MNDKKDENLLKKLYKGCTLDKMSMHRTNSIQHAEKTAKKQTFQTTTKSQIALIRNRRGQNGSTMTLT